MQRIDADWLDRDEVAAPVDEINEAARIEASTTGGHALASKQPIERRWDDEVTSGLPTSSALRAMVSAAIATDGVVDVFAQAGLSNPELSIFSDDFVDKVRDMKGNENLRIKMLQKLLNEEIRSMQPRSAVRYDKFSEQLQKAINRYRTRALTSAQIIEELIELAKAIRAAEEESSESGMTPDEYAFYEELAADESAHLEMADDKLRALAAELLESLKREVTIDWDRRSDIQASIRAKVKRLLRLRGYPPEYSDQAIEQLLQQTDLFARQWSDG